MSKLDSAGGRGAIVRVPVLMYHVISRRRHPLPGLVVSPNRFERQIRRLARLGYTGITASAWVSHATNGGRLPSRPVILTFDDADAELCEHAFPVLERYGFAGSVYVVTHRLGQWNTWDGADGLESHRLMDAEQIRHWATRGIEFGGHTRTHVNLSHAEPAVVESEIRGSADDLTAILNARPVSFAYPYGAFDERAIAVVRDVYAIAFSTQEGIADLRTDPWRLPRFMVLPTDRPLELTLAFRLGWSPRHALRRSSCGVALRRLRRRAQLLARHDRR